MRKLRRLSLLLLWVPLVALLPRPALPAGGADRSARVDKLFARYDRPDSPGCALAVIQDGRVVYQRGYGMANLEHRVPIAPDTVFNIASVSKQFTAFLIHLLASLGLLSLDDDVHKHVPELPDFGKKITIRHLIHHTSGLREDWSMLTLAGWRQQDVVTQDDVLGLVVRQKELNFEPGQEYLYCNTGYSLLGRIVERVGGKSLRAYAQEKIFMPLGMKSSVFQDDPRMLIRNRATSYSPAAGGGFQQVPYASGRVGPGNLYTTVEDLARWDQNFYEPRAGGPKVIASMLVRGKLNDGKDIAYAAGLRHGEYRGLTTVEHLGSIAGYRSILLRFPEQRFSVILLANVSNFNAGLMARQVADVYLEDKLKPAPVMKADKGKLSPKQLDEYAGEYRFASGLVVPIARQGKDLVVEGAAGKVPLVPLSATEFLAAESGARYRFVKPASDKEEMKLVLRADSQEQTGVRVQRAKLEPKQLADYVGQFYSEELDVIYRVQLRDGKLYLRHRKGESQLRPLSGDEFTSDVAGPVTVRFTRGDGKQVRELLVSTPRARNVRFTRAEIKFSR